MKILLIYPNPKGLGLLVNRHLPLGLLYISASLRQSACHDIKIIDARANDLGHQEVCIRIKNFAPDIVGISGLSTEATEVHKLASLAKQINPRCKVVIGGPYATSSPEFIIQDPHVDFVVIGEGERTTCNLIEALETGRDVSGLDGLAFKNGSRPVINLPKNAIEDIDSIPLPAWDLIDMEGYLSERRRHSENPIPASNRIAPLFTSRGCPFGCIYCHNIFGKKIRLRSVRSVIREIELLIGRYNVAEIEIIDDIFNFDLERAKQICDEIIKRGIKIKLSFPNGLRIDGMDQELIVKLKQAGTHMVYYAIESASARVQQEIRKNLDLEKARQIIRQTVQQGIITGASFMLGFPGESKDEMLKTVKFAKDADFHIANFYYVTPYPGTNLFKKLKMNNAGLEITGNYSFLKLSFNASSVPDAELKRIRARAYRQFYLRPSQMRRIWKAIPDKMMLFKNLCLVLKRSMIN